MNSDPSSSGPWLFAAMADGGILGIIQRKNPEREFEILKQIGSGTYGEVYEVRMWVGGCEEREREILN